MNHGDFPSQKKGSSEPMSLFDKIRQQKLLSLSLIVFTLAIGIVIGTLINTGVNAAKSQSPAPDATPLVIPAAKPITNEFSKLAKELEPSVVNISTDYTPKASARKPGGNQEGDEDEDDDAMDLFRRFFKNGPQGRQIPPRAFRREATGSGFIVDKNGYILTNNHVVEDADHIKVKMPHDPTEYRAKLIGMDLETDLAIIKMEGAKSLVPVRIGNSDAVQVGDWAVAIGSPFGLEATVTAGIVSATGRDIQGARQFQHFIQTDAAINPGNSGGPLLNINGEVVGINTAIATRSGGYQGVGFALPINTAVAVYNSIIRTGRMSRGSIGIRFSKYDNQQELMKALGLKNGVIVQQVTPGGPAEKAGIKDDDVIIAFNGQPVKDGDALVTTVSQQPIGSQATITVDRSGKRQDLKITIGDRDEQLAASNDPEFQKRTPRGGEETDKPENASQAKFGISIRPATDAERDAAGITDKHGVVVTQVQEGSFADDVRVLEKDIIVSINRQPVSSVEDIRRIQSSLKPGDAVAFRVLRPEGSVVPRANRTKPTYTGLYLSGTLQNNP
jgi:serine protease Do